MQSRGGTLLKVGGGAAFLGSVGGFDALVAALVLALLALRVLRLCQRLALMFTLLSSV